MATTFPSKFGAVLCEVSKLYSEKFDRVARGSIGISLAQYRLLAALAMHEDAKPLSQVKLAKQVELSTMGVTGLCERMEQKGWISRKPSDIDRRINEVRMERKADEALDALMTVGNAQADEALSMLSVDERAKLLQLLGKVHGRLRQLAAGYAAEQAR